MALPSTSLQPSPNISMLPPPSVHTGRPNAPVHKRGGQPGNQNARKLGTFSTYRPGSLSPTRDLIKDLRIRLKDPASPPDQIVAQARIARQELPLPHPTLASIGNFIQVVQLSLKLSGIVSSAWASCIPAIRLTHALESIAHDPFGWFGRGYKDSGISRDADSFFIVSEKSAQNSPLPPSHPILATNLTDSQWAVLAPLIPPDPRLDFLTGEPPVIIAANRWGFTQYYSTGEFNDFVIMENYHKILQRCPGLVTPTQASSPRKKRGRPRTSPRALLDAILWKLATGQNWDALPFGFPPMRVCRKYYRRLFNTGRLYTLLLALYNHMRIESSTDLPGLLEAGVFTTTPSQKIALSPEAPATSENYTALLFMQLARSAFTRLHRQHKQAHPISLPLLPDFKGAASLSTGMIPGLKAKEPELVFEPLEDSLAWKKWRKIERDQKTIAREVSKRLHASEGAFPERSALRAVEGQGISSLLSQSDLDPEGEEFDEQPEQEFQPLEDSLAWQKWRKIEQNQKTIAEEVAKRLHSTNPPNLDHLLAASDEED